MIETLYRPIYRRIQLISSDRIREQLDKKRIVLVTGLRGSGKTTFLKNLSVSALFVDLEDPRLSPRPTRQTLEVFSRSGGSPLVFDEVGRIDDFLSWARETVRKRNIGIVASCSGREDCMGSDTDVDRIHLRPYSFSSWISESNDKSVNNKNRLPAFLRSSGFQWMKSRDSVVRWFHGILFHDVVCRREIRDIDKLTAVSVYLISKTSSPVSASRLKGLLSKSVDQARMYLSILEKSGLITLVTRIEDSGRKQAQASRLCFSADRGMSLALANQEVPLRDLAETAVQQELQGNRFDIQAWRSKERWGLAIVTQGKPRLFIDVEYGLQEESHRFLAAAMSAYSCPFGLCLSHQPERVEIKVRGGTILQLPLESWLLQPEYPGIFYAPHPNVDVRKPPDKPDLPTRRHLL